LPLQAVDQVAQTQNRAAVLFLRWLRLQIAVTYNQYASSFQVCRLALHDFSTTDCFFGTFGRRQILPPPFL
jgi:hypothetical protein